MEKNAFISPEERKSLRGRLIEIVLEDLILDNIAEPLDEVHLKLQEGLNYHLNFETKVSEVIQNDKNQSGNIQFKDENGIVRLMDFTIINTGTIVDNF